MDNTNSSSMDQLQATDNSGDATEEKKEHTISDEIAGLKERFPLIGAGLEKLFGKYLNS